MRILLINHYAGSPAHGMEYRPFYLAREWVKQGHVVTIVGASHSHVRSRQPEVVSESIDGVTYRWIAAPAYQGNGVGRTLNIAVFCARLAVLAKRLARELQPDVVIASSTYPFDIWPAARIARFAGAKLVHEVHDLWPLSPIELGGMSRRHPFIVACQSAEDYACRHADVVVSMLPKVHEHLASRGLDLRKLRIVPNGVLPEEWRQAGAPLPDAVNRFISTQKQEGRHLVVYAGAHGVANALDALLDAAAQLASEPFAFLLVGDGTERSRLVQRVAHEKFEHLMLAPPIPKSQVPTLLAAADTAFVGLQRVPIFRFGIAPNKLMDYMMAGCVILNAIEAGNDPVSDSGCGVTVEAESPRAIANGLRQLAALTPSQRAEMGQRGREYVMAHHTWPVLAQQFIEAVS